MNNEIIMQTSFLVKSTTMYCSFRVRSKCTNAGAIPIELQ